MLLTMRISFLITFLACGFLSAQSQSAKGRILSVNGFTQWITGRDSATLQWVPATGRDALIKEGKKTVAHARFKVVKYGEMSFPINPSSGTEAVAADLSKSRFITIEYKANHELVLQLRQTGIHGGTHNHIILPAATQFIKTRIYFSSFKGGLKPLDLKDVAKFNFAFLGNNPEDGFAEVMVRSFKIDRYKPL
jgi:hypothetical protein